MSQVNLREEPAHGAVLPLDDAGPLGFGCYRVSATRSAHAAAMKHALDVGCTLIDTAGNYMDGQSETLVGHVLREWSGPVFTVTKAGYVAPALRRELSALGVPERLLSPRSTESYYSLHVDVLRASLRLSLSRMGVDRIGALLLHNPENARVDTSADDVYRQIGAAFEFLEECVARGVIQCYGLSSNSVVAHAGEDESPEVSLPRVLSIATATSGSNAFRILQTPCNLLERDTAAVMPPASTSVVDLGRTAGLTLMANRPLNAFSNGAPVRLTGSGEPLGGTEGDIGAFESFRLLIATKLEQSNADHAVYDFPLMRFFRDSWDKIHHPELVDQIFERQVSPFVVALCEGNVPGDMANAVRRLHAACRSQARHRMWHDSADVRARLAVEGLISSDEDLALQACRFPLTQGFQHVLVGMRDAAYVDELSPVLRMS
ncbi:aldo/keto reductase [Streptomyces sp. NPDC002602]|uniref:aldo/keto reductase n=1 Tax=Streptomyces sp. NPDC002602 TaxID=3364654 RepID=UPI0036B18C52